MRIIDAEALEEEIKSLHVTVTGLRAGKGVLDESMKQYRDSILRIIREQATVEQVRKNDQSVECSLCGCEYKMNYCPECGANLKL